MDPQTTWRDLLRAWSDRDWEAVAGLAETLLDWIGRDGFPPKTMLDVELGTELNLRIANAAASCMLARARSVLAEPNGIPADVAFTLACANCNNEGPSTFADAISIGWTDVVYVPAGMSENFLGRCASCNESY